MKSKFLLWLLAFVITLATAYYQKRTGPTYPLSESVKLENSSVTYKLYRSHGGTSDHIVSIDVEDVEFTGTLFWKRFKTDDEWNIDEMVREGSTLTGLLPNQPPAGKLLYYIELQKSGNKYILPLEENVIIRFKGDVPLWLLILHVITMFGAMLLSTRTGLEAFAKKPKLIRLTLWTLGLLLVGGLILGPLVQKYAFGAYWTGFPFGHDLTDNKTIVAFIGWLFAFFKYRKAKHPALWALFAAILLMVVYLIPHSLLGSELDYNKLDKAKVSVTKSITK